MQPLSEKDERMWAMFSHLGALLMFTGLGNVIAPLVIWAIYREESPLVEANARASANFQITMSIAMIVAGLSLMCGVGIALVPAIAIFDIVFAVQAAIAANEGKVFAYPNWATFEFIK